MVPKEDPGPFLNIVGLISLHDRFSVEGHIIDPAMNNGGLRIFLDGLHLFFKSLRNHLVIVIEKRNVFSPGFPNPTISGGTVPLGWFVDRPDFGGIFVQSESDCGPGLL